MASQLTALLGLFSLISTVYCGEITVVYTPSTLRFGSASTLRASNLDDILIASLGYTPTESSAWNGLTITSPFSLPLAAVVLEVHGGGANIRQEGSTYTLKEDTPMSDVYHGVKSLIGSRAQRETLFKHISVDDNLEEKDGVGNVIPAPKVLNLTLEPDATFMREMASFIKTAMTIGEMTTTNHGGQDVIFMELNALAPLVKVYGVTSPKVIEAINILRSQMERVTNVMRQVYSDRVLVITATIDQLQELSRASRSILEADAHTAEDLNVASEYSPDFPAIFNIVLIIAIILIVFVVGASVAMATMDPGKDSIIYRMTNPRMKKDN